MGNVWKGKELPDLIVKQNDFFLLENKKRIRTAMFLVHGAPERPDHTYNRSFS